MKKNTFEAVIDSDSFHSKDNYDRNWKGGYPWGSDHNGSVRMAKNCVSIEGGILTLTATRLRWEEGKSGRPPYLPIRYHSGAIHAAAEILINETFPAWEIRGDFQAPSVSGSWPAFWLTGVKAWPPEIDILEFKGSNVNWFNTFHLPNRCDTNQVVVENPVEWHQYKAWIELGDDGEVWVHYYIDGQWKCKHRAPRSIVNCPMNLIINLQMEGSSGKSGPHGSTVFRARNVYVGRQRKQTNLTTENIIMHETIKTRWMGLGPSLAHRIISS